MKFDNANTNMAWCPGCGNHGILMEIKKAMEQAGFENTQTVVVSGIGQAAKAPQYIRSHYFNGLHGRALPVAAGIKAANKYLNVVVASGDGDLYGEGGNHFIHGIRRNPNITVVAFNNMTYGLTKGQASPTSKADFTTKVQPKGTDEDPFNPIAVAIAQNISFAARAVYMDADATINILKEAMLHKGFALVDILTHCVTFNHSNTTQWIRENTYYLENHDPTSRMLALEKELTGDKMPLGILYRCDKPVFEENRANIHKTQTPLYQQKVDIEKLKSYL